MFHTLLAQIAVVLMVATCCGALVFGRWPERVVAVAYSLDWLGSALWADRRPRHHGQPAWLALDAALLVVLLILTASCRRTWLLWMSACSFLVVLTHLAVLMDTRLTQWSYLTAYSIWSAAALLCFSIGVAVEGRRPVTPLIRLA